jgi:hypothetical protein
MKPNPPLFITGEFPPELEHHKPLLTNALLQCGAIVHELPVQLRASAVGSLLGSFLVNDTTDPFLCLEQVTEQLRANLEQDRGKIPGSDRRPAQPRFTNDVGGDVSLDEYPHAEQIMATTTRVMRILMLLHPSVGLSVLGATASNFCAQIEDPFEAWSFLKDGIDDSLPRVVANRRGGK